MGDGPPGFRRNFTCSAVLRIHSGDPNFSATGLLPCLADRSRSLRLNPNFVTPYRVSYNPKRQASWFGLIPFRSPLLRESQFAFSSSRYLDVSVPWVCLNRAMNSRGCTARLKAVGSPIRKSPDHRSLTAPRGISVLVPSFIDS